MTPPASARPEPQYAEVAAKLNWLRAGVLGANDGIVSTAALVVGMAAATSEIGTVLTAGVAGLIAGAVSMALGEYVSVSTQRDTEHALIELEKSELTTDAEQELHELADLYEAKGLSPETATRVAEELTAHDALAAHLDAELHISAEEISNPWTAAFASGISFTVGSTLPLLAVILSPADWRVAAISGSTIIALILTGWLSASLGGSKPLRPTVRVVIGGILALVLTWAIGSLFGTTVI